MPGRSRRVPALAAALALAVLAAFAPVVRNGFVSYDDDTHLVGNPRVQQGLTGEALRWAFTTTETQNWHPLTWVSHIIDFRLFGRWAGGHHAVSALLHAANAALLFLLLHAMTGAFWRSALVAALFGLHPLRVESVAWAAERKDVLSLLFGLLAAGAWLRYVRGRAPRWYAAALALAAAALMSKAMLVTLPALLLLLELWPLGRWSGTGARRWPGRALLLEKAPFLALSAAVGVIAYRAQESGGAVGDAVRFPLAERLGNAVTAYGAYLAKTLWPTKLAALYPYAWNEVPRWQPVASLALLAALSAAAVLCLRRWPALPVGWAWYLGTLLPVAGIIQIGSQSMAYRYTYLPQIGVLLAAAWGLGALTASHPAARGPALAAVSLALTLLAGATWVTVGHWRTSVTLFSRAVAVTENNHIALYNLGSSLMQAGKVAEGQALIGRALKISPEFRAVPYERGGDWQAASGRKREAAQMYRKALELTPRNAALRAKLRALEEGERPRRPPGTP